MRRRAGFTLIEMVVAMAVAAILFSFARPSMVAMGEAERIQEEKAEEGKIIGMWQKGIGEYERSWDGDTIVGGSEGAGRDETKIPTLGGVPGYSPAETPAPDTAPVLVDWSFQLNAVIHPWGYDASPAHCTRGYLPFNLGYNASNGYKYSGWVDPNNDGVASCDELARGIQGPGWKYSCRAAGNQCTTPWCNYAGIGINRKPEDDVRLGTIRASVGVPISEPAPQCRVDSLAGYGWRNNLALGYEYMAVDGISNQSWFYYKAGWTPTYYSATEVSPGRTATPKKVKAPSRYRLTCRPYSEKHGVEYRILNVSKPTGVTDQSTFRLSVRTTHSMGGVPEVFEERATIQPTDPGTAICERVGPQPPVKAEEKGAFGMAADFSGWCVAQDRKIPTYKDRNRTQPTTAHTDPVMSVGETVDDATNC